MVLLEKLILIQLVKKFPDFLEPAGLFTFVKKNPTFIPYSEPVQSHPPLHTVCCNVFLILLFHLHLDLPSGLSLSLSLSLPP
jgi:hypothetical protein